MRRDRSRRGSWQLAASPDGARRNGTAGGSSTHTRRRGVGTARGIRARRRVRVRVPGPARNSRQFGPFLACIAGPGRPHRTRAEGEPVAFGSVRPIPSRPIPSASVLCILYAVAIQVPASQASFSSRGKGTEASPSWIKDSWFGRPSLWLTRLPYYAVTDSD